LIDLNRDGLAAQHEGTGCLAFNIPAGFDEVKLLLLPSEHEVK
jgi:hypothetical protein